AGRRGEVGVVTAAEVQAMTNETKGYPPIRRVVTGHDANETAKVLIDGPPTNRRTSKSGGVSTLIWCTDRTPADISVGENIEDMGARRLGTPPPPNGTRFTVNDIPPGRTGPMHRTETIDYVIVLAGELEMQMDDSTVKLKAGDVLVQRGTNHAWINRGTGAAVKIRNVARGITVTVVSRGGNYGAPELFPGRSEVSAGMGGHAESSKAAVEIAPGKKTLLNLALKRSAPILTPADWIAQLPDDRDGMKQLII